MLRASLFTSLCGTSELASAFAISNKIPMSIFDLLFGSAIAGCFIPEFSLKKQRKKEYTSAFFITVFSFTAFFVFLGMFYSNRLAKIIARGLSPYAVELTSNLLIILLPSVLFACGTYLITALCHAYKYRFLPAAVSVLSNLFVILVFFNIREIKTESQYYFIAFCFSFSWFLQFIFVSLPFIKKTFALLKPDFRLIKSSLKRFPTSVFSSWLLPFSLTSSMFFSSLTSKNGGALFDYASVLFCAVTGIISSVIGGYIFPVLSDSYINKDDFSKKAVLCLKESLFISLPICIFILILSKELVNIAYLRGNFSEHDAVSVSQILSVISMALPYCTLNEILMRIFDASNNNFIAAEISFLGSVVVLVLQVISYKLNFGVLAIVFSFVLGQILSSFFGLVMGVKYLSQKTVLPSFKDFFFPPVVFSAAVGVSYAVFSQSVKTDFIIVVAVCFIGLLSYLPFLLKNKRKEI